MKKILVVGSGIMGAGISEVCAINGYEIYMYDIQQAFVDKGMENIKQSLEKLHKKGVVNEQPDAILSRITPTINFSNNINPDIIIEAAPENISIKKKIFSEVSKTYSNVEILASTTSSLSITELGSVTPFPDRVIGLHFFNPAPIMKLVEIIPGYMTSKNIIESSEKFIKTLKKEISYSADLPGFVTSRMIGVIVNEAAWMLYESVSSKEEIDKGIVLGLNHPMGPLALADMIGIDTVLKIIERLYTGFGDPKYRPCPILYNMVYSNKLGKKTGEGFYKY
ncbi:MAG: 3-hydroxyacyl-CoA dehydrogenase family protein [Thermoplasmata archaeon]